MGDIRVAWRFLLKRRTSTAIAVLTLGVAIGVCTIAVGVVDQAFWRAPQGDRGGELVTIYNSRPAAPYYQTISFPDYTEIRDRARDGVDLAAFVRIDGTLAGGEWPVRIWGELVSGNYFSVIGTSAYAGRLLSPDDDGAASGAPIVLGYELWQRSFGGNPSIVGSPIRFGRTDFTVVGIAPPGFHGPAWSTELWVPLRLARTVFGIDVLSRRDVPLLQTVGRPRDSRLITQLQALTTFPTSASNDGWRLSVFPAVYLRFWPAYRASMARFLGVFVAIAVCILIIACANLGGLLIARAGERQRELALRQALGATRLQLFRRLAAESGILVTLGGILGALFAVWVAAFVQRIPVPVPAQVGVTFDLRLAFTCAVVSFAASLLLVGLSALRGLRTDVRGLLASSSQTLAGRLGASRVLVVAQIALCCTLLTVGGLLLRSALQVETIDVGFAATEGIMGRVAISDQGYDAAAGGAFYQRLETALAELPQVEAVALEWHPPLTNIRVTGNFALNGSDDALAARYDVVSAGYFKALGIRVLSGREFDGRDRATSEPVAIVNESIAAKAGANPVDQTIRLASEPFARRIVGVVREVKYNKITEPPQPFVYLPLAQAFRGDLYVHVRTRGAGAVDLLRQAIARIDPHVALSDVRSISDQLADARAAPRASAIVSSGAALLAVLLALLGVYGVLMTSVEQRRHELAIRAALGATPREIVRRVVREGCTLTIIGLVAGMIASVGAGRLIADQLFEVQPQDALVMATVPLLVLVVSGVAWLAPARRAARVDPVGVLKSL